MTLPPRLASAKPEVCFPVLHMPRLELCFTDGSLLWLRQTTPDPLKRSFDHQGETLTVDLGALVPMLHDEVYHAPEGDRAGVIFFNLRHKFKTAQDFIAAVRSLPTAERNH